MSAGTGNYVSADRLRFGRRVLYRRDVVEAWIQAQQQAAQPETSR